MALRWHEEADKYINAARKYPLRILVWGPGKPDKRATPEERKPYEKRVQIKSVLRKHFPNAEVYMSEDPEMNALAPGVKDKLKREAIQARTADLVLVLAIGRGTALEIDHFVTTYPWIRDKMYILLQKRYVRTKGLVKEVYKLLSDNQIEGYTDHEFHECLVATVKAVDIATEVGLARVLRD